MKFENTDLVIARYNEDVDWIKSEYSRIFIYNKGQHLNRKDEISLPNIGRESQTYLHHIVENFNNLNNITIFTQGNPDVHYFHNRHYNEEYFFEMKKQAEIYGYSLNKDYYPNVMFGGYKDGNYRDHHPTLRDPNIPLSRFATIGKFHEYIFGKSFDQYKWYANGIFAISKEKILSRSIDFYKKILLDEEQFYISGELGSYLERTWTLIFNIPDNEV